MKKILLSILAVSLFYLAQAQTTPGADSLQQYVGKYKFPEGSVVAEVGIVLDNGTLMATSDMGNSELRRIEGDVFEVVSFAGTATFKRSPESKVNGIKIVVDDVILEGPKSETINITEQATVLNAIDSRGRGCFKRYSQDPSLLQ